MAKKEIIDFIKKERILGQNDEQIETALLEKGWSNTETKLAFHVLQSFDTVSQGSGISFLEVEGEGIQKDFQSTYAGFWIRSAASLVDAAVILIVTTLLYLLAHTDFNLVYLLYFLYTIIMTKVFGATLGKMALKMKVIRENSNKLGWARVILRETVGKFISSFFYIGYIMVAFDSRKQGLHDKIAGTFVLQEHAFNQKKLLRFVIIAFAAILLIAFLVGLFSGIKNGSRKLKKSTVSGENVSTEVGKANEDAGSSEADLNSEANYDSQNTFEIIDGVRADFSIDKLEGQQNLCDGIIYGRKTTDTGHEISVCVKKQSCCDEINGMDFDVKKDNNLNRLLLKYNHKKDYDCNCGGSYIQLKYRITNLPKGELSIDIAENKPDLKLEDAKKIKVQIDTNNKERTYDFICAGLKIVDRRYGNELDIAQPVMEKYSINYEEFSAELKQQMDLIKNDAQINKEIKNLIIANCK